MNDKLHSGLSAAQIERLAVLGEELGEVQQRIGKVLRHGYSGVHPTNGHTNLDELEIEVGDVLAAIELMYQRGDIDHDRIIEYRDAKLERLGKYLHHNQVNGWSSGPFQVREGYTYRTKSGHEVRIFATDGGGCYPALGAIKYGDVWVAEGWTVEGVGQTFKDIDPDSEEPA